MPTLIEAEVEAVLLDQMRALGYACLNDATSEPDGPAPERECDSDTILAGRLCAAMKRLNPHILRTLKTLPYAACLLGQRQCSRRCRVDLNSCCDGGKLTHNRNAERLGRSAA